jgi:uncharacterized ABC transporter ATP-binding protein MJ1023
VFTFDNLYFRYREYLFEGYTGELKERKVAITGRNGSGKTTLLRLMDGQLKPESGHIRVMGTTYMVDFDLSNYKNFSAADIIALCEPLRSFNTAPCRDLAEMLQFEEYLEIPVGELSKGSAKKVSLLLGFMSNADILLLDEPFESIDAVSNQAIIDWLKSADRGIVLVGHDIERVKQSVEQVFKIHERGLISL